MSQEGHGENGRRHGANWIPSPVHTLHLAGCEMTGAKVEEKKMLVVASRLYRIPQFIHSA